MSASSSAALPLAHMVLRVLIVVNWLGGLAILLLLVAFPTRHWIMTSMHLSPSPEADRIVLGLRTVAVIGLVSIPMNHAILKRLLAIVETVRLGDPFVAANAAHLHSIAWVMLALQILSVIVGRIATRISTPEHPVHLSAGFSISGWLAVLLTFVLARVFAEGALMRDDLVGTV